MILSRLVVSSIFFIFTILISFGQSGKVLEHTFYLIGDAGEPSQGKDSVLDLLLAQLSVADERSTVIFLGDNVYPRGLPGQDAEDREEMEKKLLRQIKATSSFNGNIFFLHGNHDWDKGGRLGWERALNQGEFLREQLEKDSVFLPLDGCPGPVEISVSEGITLIIINSQWLLHPWDKPTEVDGCNNFTTPGVLEQLDEILKRNKHKKILLAQHHPLFTYGVHGGAFRLRDHLFPLTNLRKNLYIPMPVIGSIYPVYRTLIGNRQDVANFEYKLIRNGMHDILKKYANVIHVAGHEHSFQHLIKDNTNYIVSGAGSKSTSIRKGKLTKFYSEHKGFTVAKYFRNNPVEISYYSAKSAVQNPVYHTNIAIAESEKTDPLNENKLLLDTTVVTFASTQYHRNGKMLLGANYRDEWETPIEVPVFDIGKEHGGLTIVQRGGGMQTKSLRLEARDGKQYVLRSVEKFPENAIPKILRNTFAGGIVKDQISASHPYAAIVIPPLAEAAGIYHTNPKIVYIPDDPRFKEYREDFANTLALYEERPQGKAKDQDYFGNADKIISTFKVLRKLKEDNDNYIDQKFVLRSRLFDMLIGDWDRHDDQWRWAKFDREKGNMYRPIPRDRDQAFFVNQGLIPKIISRKWGLPKIEGFDEDVNWAPGLMFNARYFDRSFLNELSREDWLSIAHDLQLSITDKVIEDAIAQWPKPIYEKNGQTIINALKSRRNNLIADASQHYDFLSKEVDILGSDKKEHFQVLRNNDGSVKVTVKKINKKNELTKTLYERTFQKDETNEIRLRGFEGRDVFVVDGEVKKSILVRIISGRGKDTIVDQSSVTGLSKKTKVYDRVKNTTLEKGGDTKAHLKKSASVHAYNRRAFVYNTLTPLLDVNINKDDGLFIGGGFLYKNHGWRKTPFKSRHKFIANTAFATNSFNINYEGTFTGVLRKWNLILSADIQEPKFVGNYFGLGNNTRFDTDKNTIDFHRVRFENNTYQIGLSNQFDSKGVFSIAAMHRGVEILESSNNDFINEQKTLGSLPSDLSEREYFYTGLATSLVFDTRDNRRLTNSGILWNTNLRALKGWKGYSSDLVKLTSSFSNYIRIRIPSVFIMANRVGVSHNFTDITSSEFFNASTLGGIENLRSYRRTRFHGGTSFYHNFDLRTKLLNFRTYLFPGELGILGFHDLGRVWLNNERSDKWHSSRGFGLWIAPVKELVVSFNYAFSNEENLPFVQFGFFF